MANPRCLVWRVNNTCTTRRGCIKPSCPVLLASNKIQAPTTRPQNSPGCAQKQIVTKLIAAKPLLNRCLSRPNQLARRLPSAFAMASSAATVPQLPKRKLGNTGLEVSVMGFGASPLGGSFGVRPCVEGISLYVGCAARPGLTLCAGSSGCG